MATTLVPYFKSICAGYLFHPKRIRCVRFSLSKRDIHIRGNWANTVKSIKSSWTFRIFAGLIVGCSFLDYLDRRETNKRERLIKAACLRNNHNFIADVVDAAADSVVHITVLDQGYIFEQLHGGSGFIIENNGLIITNAHVVGKALAKNVQVTLRNGKTYAGIVKDADEVTDLALVQISGKGLPALKLGSGNGLRPGEWVIAIGSPLFLSNTVTAGVVSSVHRRAAELGLKNHNINYIQTDTTIVRGNSGGPLVNLDGEVVGVNTMTLAPGISFAIPAEYVKEFMERYNRKSSHEGLPKYYLGLSYLTLNPTTMSQILSIVQLPENLKHGLYVWQVEPNSPASVAGLQSGDVIFQVEGDNIYDIKCLFKKLDEKSTVTLLLYRKGVYYKANITPKKRFW